MKCLPLRYTLQALSDLFFDMVNNSDESSGKTSKSLCSKLLINTVKRDISFVGASFELSSIPVLLKSHISISKFNRFQSTPAIWNQHNKESTIVDKYLSIYEYNQSSLYQFIAKNGRVPVLYGPTQGSWPLEENYCKTTLLLQFPI